MRRSVLVTMLGLAAVGAAVLRAAGDMPLWAYGYTAPPPLRGTPAAPAPAAPSPPAPAAPRTAEGSTRSFTRAQIYNLYGPADWFPDAHPPMPPIVATGRESAKIFA